MSTTDAPPEVTVSPNPWCAGTRPARLATRRHPPTSRPIRIRVLILATVGFTFFFAVWVMFAIVGIPSKEFGLSDGSSRSLSRSRSCPGRSCASRSGSHRRARRPGRLHRAAPRHRRPGVPDQPRRHLHALIVLALFLGLAGTSFAVGIAVGLGLVPGRPAGLRARRLRHGQRRRVDHEAPRRRRSSRWSRSAGLPAASSRAAGASSPSSTDRSRDDGRACGSRRPPPTASPAAGPVRRALGPLHVLRVWRFGLYYIVVFGAYVALSLWLPNTTSTSTASACGRPGS